MTLEITILVATMGGTAELAAEEIANYIEDSGGSAKIVRMENATPATLAQGGLFVICSSTYGTGEVPDNGKPFYAALTHERPDLSEVRYGVMALGDSIYPNTFAFGGKKFDALFSELGATRIGDICIHDARGKIYPEDAAIEWAEAWLEAVGAH
ncbi:flavodoxin domain-containing protein [Sphingobium subterraneum]|uniref:MioC protein n=1 Tax=Sphingobium subterraneum TaxID=627688 RepID=A0A841IXR9_9SPHN|nr:flavodoxin domain-containing protein [Sphingobium subterraneum]MBB6123090.1 MioC protein [Sphingobium subterraneum]